MADKKLVELLAAADRSSTGTGTAVDIGALRRAARIEVHVVEVVGAASAVITIKTAASEAGPFRVVAERICGGAMRHAFPVGSLERYVLAEWNVQGGATVNLTVTAEAHVVYCEPRELPQYALPQDALEGSFPDDLVEAAIACSTVAEGYLNGSFNTPILGWDIDLRLQTGKLIAAEVLRVRGTDPAGPDQLVFDERDEALKWFGRIADGKLKPPGIIDSTPDDFEGGAVVESSGSARGW